MNILYKFECDSTKSDLFNNRLSTSLRANKQDIRHFLRSDMYNFDDAFNPFWWDVDLIALLISMKISTLANNKVYLECDSITEQYFNTIEILDLFDGVNNTPDDYTEYTPGIPELDSSVAKVHTAGMHRKWRGLRIWQPNSIYVKQRLKDLHEAVNDLLDYSDTNNVLSKQYFKDLFRNNNALVKQGYYTPFRKDRYKVFNVYREWEGGVGEGHITITHLCPSDSYVSLIKQKINEDNLQSVGIFQYYQHDIWSLIQDDEYAKNVKNKEDFPNAFLYTSANCKLGPEPYGTNIKLNDAWDAPNTIVHNYTTPKHEYLANEY